MKRALLLCCALGLVACSRAERPAPERCTEQDAGSPVDPLLLAFLSRARSAHHAADNLETNGDLNGALTPLAGLVAGPLPHSNGAELAPEVREVLADTLARLADFHSRLGAFDQALADVKAGLENAGGPNYFQGHLLETQGLVEERRAKSLEASDPKAAAEARRLAIGLLESAMVVQSKVIEQGTGTAGAGDPAASAAPAASPH
ncbi:MAG TPA: hypothetical protein VIK01_08575 [Polyangiaceae bacterium]